MVVHYGGSRDAAAETTEEIEALGTRAWPLQADLRSESEIDSLFEAIRRQAGVLDVLVNSAASFECEPFEDIDSAAWDETQTLNLRAPFLLTQRAVGLMRSSGAGAIVNIADLSGVKPWKTFARHGTSKAALIHLTRATAYELAPVIRVNCVVPGAILPPPGVDEESEEWQKRGRIVPAQRTGHPSDVAGAVAFLIESEFITGAVLPVDGGEHLAAPRAALE